MRIRAQVAKASNDTIASSMIESSPPVRRSMRQGHDLVINPDPTSVGTKLFSQAQENILKQTAEHLVSSKTGTAKMQFIFDLIWNQSRPKYLIAIAAQEAEL